MVAAFSSSGKRQSLIGVLMQSVRCGQMAVLDILRTFDAIPPLDAFLVFSALICSGISHWLTCHSMSNHPGHDNLKF